MRHAYITISLAYELDIDKYSNLFLGVEEASLAQTLLGINTEDISRFYILDKFIAIKARYNKKTKNKPNTTLKVGFLAKYALNKRNSLKINAPINKPLFKLYSGPR